MMSTDNQEKKEITKEQAEEIFGDRGESLMIAKKTVFCHDCFPKNHKSVEMEIEHYFVNDLFDVILRGKCSVCGHPVSRYIESGENEESKKIAIKFWREKKTI